MATAVETLTRSRTRWLRSAKFTGRNVKQTLCWSRQRNENDKAQTLGLLLTTRYDVKSSQVAFNKKGGIRTNFTNLNKNNEKEKTQYNEEKNTQQKEEEW